MPENVGLVAEQLICDVLAVTVSDDLFDSVVPAVNGVDPDKVAVPVPKSMVLMFPLSLDIDPAVRL